MTSTRVTADGLREFVGSDGIVLLDFWADWCPPCRAFAPVFEAASEANADLRFGKIDTEAERELAAGFRITSIPTLVAFRDGVMVYAQPGALRAPQLDMLIDAIRGLDMDEVREQASARTEEVAR